MIAPVRQVKTVRAYRFARADLLCPGIALPRSQAAARAVIIPASSSVHPARAMKATRGAGRLISSAIQMVAMASGAKKVPERSSSAMADATLEYRTDRYFGAPAA